MSTAIFMYSTKASYKNHQKFTFITLIIHESFIFLVLNKVVINFRG